MSGKAPFPLVIIVEAITPRIEYAMGTSLREILGFDFVLMLPGEHRPDIGLPCLNYTRSAITGTLPMACNGLLYEEDIRPGMIGFGPAVPPSDREALCKTDHFAYLFYRLTEYSHWSAPIRDGHGRYRDAILDSSVEQGLAHLESKLAPIYDRRNPPREGRKFDFEVTIDVDHPWKFRHKGAAARWGGLVKDLLRMRWGLLRERLRFMRNGVDPYEVAEKEILRLCPPGKTTVFFLVDGDHRLDSRFSLRMEPYRNQVERYREDGYSLGLHPSYETWLDAGKLRAEKQLLEEVVGPVTRSRQHYLRYQLPETFRYLCEAGIREEYSICPVGGTGAKTGILRPYFWFDLGKNETTPMRIQPAVVMDRNLQQYQGLEPEQALAEIRKWIAEVRKWRGKFILVLHNETFCESGEWKGWRAVIEAVMEELKAT